MKALDSTKKVLNKYNVNALKRYGQNFLVSDDAIEKIVESTDIGNNDLVIEIGPGIGTLTQELLKLAKKVIAIEIDERMVNILDDRFAMQDKLQIVNNDILKVTIKDIIKNRKDYDKIRIVGNLPYYITTPILFSLLEKDNDIESITVMIQKEVADRIMAKSKTKDYGVLTIMTNLYCNVKRIIEVPRESFMPSPNVDSTVLLLTPNDMVVSKIFDTEVFKKVVKGGFSQRRKTLVNSLEAAKICDMNKQEWTDLLKKLNINELSRAEEICIEDYITISNELSK